MRAPDDTGISFGGGGHVEKLREDQPESRTTMLARDTTSKSSAAKGL